MNRWGLAVGAVALTVATACSPSPPPASSSEETTTTTTTVPRIVDDSGRPPVTFDPCFDLPDDVMNAAGYDAAKKELADMPMGSYTFLGCTYDKVDYVPGVRRGYGLNVLSGNVSFDEELEKNGHIATRTSVNGRPALLEVDPGISDACKYALQADFGVVLITRIYNKDHPGPVPQSEWCSGMEDLVASMEQVIGNR